MSITTMTSHEFDQDTVQAMRETRSGPVFITDHGQPAHVPMNMEHYQQLRGGVSIADRLAMHGSEDIDFEPAQVHIDLKPADLS